MQSEQELNEKFAINDQLHFEQNSSGIIVAEIMSQFSRVTISTYGAQVLSYLPEGEVEDVLFLSEKAIYGHGKAIRGGVPVCWPCFSDDDSGFDLPAHGFARNQVWQVIATNLREDRSVTISLALGHTDASMAIWPYEFSLVLEVVVSDSLEIVLTTKNLSQESFTITQALHTYFNIRDIDDIAIVGLDKLKYLDKLAHFSEKRQQGHGQVAGEIDRVYLTPPPTVNLTNTGFARDIVITSAGTETLVVWNPGRKTASLLSDIDATAYKNFICIETANALVDKVLIGAGACHSISAKYKVEKS
jgi:glucose-6-phosphate 1-epimerase